MTEWQNGRMAEWRYGRMAEWRNSGMGMTECRMAEWRNGGMVFYDIPNLPCYIYGTQRQR
jgi:hypothetical protein